MKKQIAIAVGVLLTLGTAVSATLNAEAQSMKPIATVETTAYSMDTKQSAQILALWKTHATTSGSVPLARPL
jgi:4-hydroxybenzoate polyprenyltransferase